MMPIYHIENEEIPVLSNLWYFLDKVWCGISICTGNGIRLLHSLYQFDDNPVPHMHYYQKD